MRETLTKSPDQLGSVDLSATIELTPPKITQAAVDSFRNATRSTHSAEIPKTFVTLYRRGEFDWLGRLNVDFKNLLHAEQEYDYRDLLQVGDQPVVRTRVVDLKERKSLTILTLHSDILVGEKIKVVSTTTFMIRNPRPEGDA